MNQISVRNIINWKIACQIKLAKFIRFTCKSWWILLQQFLILKFSVATLITLSQLRLSLILQKTSRDFVNSSVFCSSTFFSCLISVTLSSSSWKSIIRYKFNKSSPQKKKGREEGLHKLKGKESSNKFVVRSYNLTKHTSMHKKNV